MSARVEAKCSEADLQQLGYGAVLTVDGITERLREACRGEANALAARTFGGPQGAVLASASDDDVACLGEAADGAARMMRKTFQLQSRCIRREHRGRPCNLTRVDARIAKEEAKAASAIDAACSDLSSLIGVDAEDYRQRAIAQGRCMVAAAHGDSGPLSLDCGARPEVTVPPRGVWTEIVLDESVWGTRCGDGSSYALWLRLAPNGSPVENVIVDMQGGGVCTNESECLGVPSGRFRGDDSPQPDGGYRSTNPSVNPFWDWTMMFLPYCNQDVFAGGGMTIVFPGITVHRFGAVNVRAALRYLRDVLWQEMNATSSEGYRPDRLRVLFGGVSAGGFGASYNYHYLLDDLRWVNTTAVPDSALGLNNGSLVGVAGLGILINGTVSGWGGRPYQPPYCLLNGCAVVPFRQTHTSARLKATPHQQILNVSNQVDNTQRSTTFFSSSAAWTNAARQAYCDTQGLPGIRYFLPADPTSLHGMLQSDSRFTSITSDGIALRDWLAAAMNDPGNVVDLVEEGTLASNPSIDPFPCVVD